MHIESHGDAAKMAEVIRDALALTKTPPAESAAPDSGQNLGIDTAQIGSILGHKGTVNGGVFQVSVPPSENIMEERMEAPPSMGTAAPLNFQPTGNGSMARRLRLQRPPWGMTAPHSQSKIHHSPE